MAFKQAYFLAIELETDQGTFPVGTPLDRLKQNLYSIVPLAITGRSGISLKRSEVTKKSIRRTKEII